MQIGSLGIDSIFNVKSKRAFIVRHIQITFGNVQNGFCKLLLQLYILIFPFFVWFGFGFKIPNEDK